MMLRRCIHVESACNFRSKERDRKSELVLRSTYQYFEWDRNNSDRNFYNVVRYAHIPLSRPAPGRGCEWCFALGRGRGRGYCKYH